MFIKIILFHYFFVQHLIPVYAYIYMRDQSNRQPKRCSKKFPVSEMPIVLPVLSKAVHRVIIVHLGPEASEAHQGVYKGRV